MANLTTIKRSPFTLIRTFIAIEILAFVAYFLLTGHGNYKYQIYTQFFFSSILPYDIAKFIFLGGAQLFITIYAFARWYREQYIFRQGSLTHEWGVFFRNIKTMPLAKSMTITIASSPLGKLMHYGSINLENDAVNKKITLHDISRPNEFIKIIERSANPQNNYFNPPDVSALLNTEEHERLEFKSSLRFDHKSGNINRELEKSVMKTITAFLNTKGGEIVIGVNDKRVPLGLNQDYASMQRPDSDGFQNHFTQAFNSMIGPEFRHLIKLSFHQIDGFEICVVQVAPSAISAYLKADNNEYFYVRTGNITTALKLSEVEPYRRARSANRFNSNS